MTVGAASNLTRCCSCKLPVVYLGTLRVAVVYHLQLPVLTFLWTAVKSASQPCADNLLLAFRNVFLGVHWSQLRARA